VSDFDTLPPPVLHSLTAADGWLLRVWDFSPIERQRPRGIIVAGHAMMADSRTLCRPDRPTLAAVLVAAGFRVLVPDLRGHGESGPLAAGGGDWSMDELVEDVSHYVELARGLEPALPLALLGHSLFSQAAMAWLGQNPDPSVGAVVAISSSVWNKRFEPSLAYWLVKRLLFWPTVVLTRLVGYLPVRKLRAGTADEPRSYWLQFNTWIRSDRWCSSDGKTDWWAGLESIRAPFLHVMSEGDRLFARPPAAIRLSARIPARELLILGRDDAPGELASLRPNHMGLVTDPRSKLAWHWIAGWIARRLGVADPA
jgi:alpha-beta hydrolase superfamily lysophospholipase